MLLRDLYGRFLTIFAAGLAVLLASSGCTSTSVTSSLDDSFRGERLSERVLVVVQFDEENADLGAAFRQTLAKWFAVRGLKAQSETPVDSVTVADVPALARTAEAQLVMLVGQTGSEEEAGQTPVMTMNPGGGMMMTGGTSGMQHYNFDADIYLAETPAGSSRRVWSAVIETEKSDGFHTTQEMAGRKMAQEVLVKLQEDGLVGPASRSRVSTTGDESPASIEEE